MIRENCSCGANITVDHGGGYPETEGRAVADWRENHRHEPAHDDGYYAFAHADSCSDDACRGGCEPATYVTTNLDGMRVSVRYPRAFDLMPGEPPERTQQPVEHLDHCRDLYCGGCEVDTEDEPGEDHGAPEPPPGTPVWWDGKWWVKDIGSAYYYSLGKYRSRSRWCDMRGAVPALAPEQVEEWAEDKWLPKYNAAEQRGYEAGSTTGIKAGREAAARDVAEFMESRKWSPAHLFYADVVRAARGGE